MAKGNGEVKFTTEGLTTESLLEVLIEAVRQLDEKLDLQAEQLAEQKEALVEVLEKVNNLSFENDGYSVED